MTENHYWKSPDNKIFMITTKENSNPGEGWAEITEEEYNQFLRPQEGK
jgi:hypothetical protein